MSVTRAELGSAKGGKLFERRMCADLPQHTQQLPCTEHGWAGQILRIGKVKIAFIGIDIRAIKHKRRAAQERIINNRGVIRHNQ